jgi:integrase
MALLTDAKIRAAKPRRERYRLTDSHGLSIEISPASTDSNPRKFWRYRYRINGKENLFAAGEWCQAPVGETAEQARARRNDGRFTLAEARIERLVWRAQVRTGQHPRLVRHAKRLLAAASAADTFEAVTREFVERRGRGWSASHRRHFIGFMERDAFPELGPLPIGTLTSAHVLAVLRKVEDRGAPSVARQGRTFIGQVTRYAVSAQKLAADPVPILRGALEKSDTQHAATLKTIEDVARFLAAIKGERVSEIAVRLLVLTMTRTVEVRTAEWTEIDLAGAEWRIPPHKMKKRRLHVVPLAPQTVALLEELKPITGGGRFLFPNRRDPRRPMGATTIAAVFARAGYEGQFSPHGTRGTASTILREEGFAHRAVELQLAHLDRDKTRRAYDHAELLPARREMLQTWADMIDAATVGAV